MMINKKILSSAIFSALLTSSAAFADGAPMYKVTITNLTNAINLTPIIVSSHRRGVAIFEAGSAASDELSAIAEGGNTAPLAATLGANNKVEDVQTSAGLLGPGQSTSVMVSAKHGARWISLASMMLPTNDGFIGLSSVKVSKHGVSTFYSPGYDAGTETNDELCISIPGPTCGGEPFSPSDDGEGYVHINRGIHGIGDLAPDVYDWRNPVVKVTVQRMRYSGDE